MKRTLFPTFATLLLLVAPLGAQEKADPTARLRDALRGMAQQVRTLQGEKDELAIKATQAEQRVAELEPALKEESRRVEEQKDALAKVQEQLERERKGHQQVTLELARWKEACAKAEKSARELEGQRRATAEKAAVLERTVADQRTRNIAMYTVGTEILERYRKFGLGTALTAREPFVGTTRVKLENLVQDYSDKLAEQRIKP